ncbi:MAG: hypothetical protein WDA65_00240 [Christensenellales bacterium]
MRKTRKILLAISFIFMALYITGCAQGDDAERAAALTQDNQSLKVRIGELENQLSLLSVTAGNKATGINCKLYPSGGDISSAQSEIDFTEGLTVAAAADIRDGVVVDYWKVNGNRLEGQELEIEVEVGGDTVIEAVLREELKVVTVNAYMQFLDDKNKPTGDKFTEYVFEYDNDKVSGKEISVYVCAEAPKGYEIDYWLIGAVPHYFNKTVTSFKALNLKESVVYEVVLKKTAVKAPSKKPTPLFS